LLLVSSFLPHLPTTPLIQTGLDSVFEDAITPTLLYLPNLTPIQESLELLLAAYTALYTLCNVRFPPSSPPLSPSHSHSHSPISNSKEQDSQATQTQRLKFLDRIIRQGILPGYNHSIDHPAIVELLVQQIGVLVPKIGIHAVKHLEDVIPILSAVMTDPFADLRASLLLEAVRAMQVVILNTWLGMREEGHRVEVVRALVVCWKTIADDEGEGEGLGEVKRDISVAGRLLVRLWRRKLICKLSWA
jgi:hypothetical protein